MQQRQQQVLVGKHYGYLRLVKLLLFLHFVQFLQLDAHYLCLESV